MRIKVELIDGDISSMDIRRHSDDRTFHAYLKHANVSIHPFDSDDGFGIKAELTAAIVDAFHRLQDS